MLNHLAYLFIVQVIAKVPEVNSIKKPIRVVKMPPDIAGVTRYTLLSDQSQKHIAHIMPSQPTRKKQDILFTHRSHVKHLTIL